MHFFLLFNIFKTFSYSAVPQDNNPHHPRSKTQWSLDCEKGQKSIRRLQIVRRLWDDRDVIKGLIVHVDDGTVHEFGAKVSLFFHPENHVTVLRLFSSFRATSLLT